MTKLLPVQYAKVLYELTANADKTQLEPLIRVFVERLNKDQMLGKVDYIISECEQYAKEKQGIVCLNIKTAHKISEELLTKITKIFGKEVETRREVDGKLIGGMVVRQGNTIFDASLQTQLSKLKRELI